MSPRYWLFLWPCQLNHGRCDESCLDVCVWHRPQICPDTLSWQTLIREFLQHQRDLQWCVLDIGGLLWLAKQLPINTGAHIHLIYGSDKKRRQILLFCKKVLTKQTDRDKHTYRSCEYTPSVRVSCQCSSIQRSISVYAFAVWHSVPTFSPVHPVAFPLPFQHRHAFIFFKHCVFL